MKEKTDKEQRHIFAQNLTYYVEKSGKMQKEVAKDLGVNETTFSMWCTENSMPNTGKIQAIAEYFGVGITALVNRHSDYSEINAEVANAIRYDSELSTMIQKYLALDADKQALVRNLVDSLS